MISERSRQIVSRVLMEGETILWCGCPDVETLVKHRADESVLRTLSRGPRSGQLVPSQKLRPWAESLSYAITDRRLLILEGEVVTDAYTPDLVQMTPQALARGPSHGDVVFGVTVGDDEQFPYAPDPQRVPTSFDRAVNAERVVKGFKGLVDAEAVRRILEDWLQDQEGGVEKTLREFVDRSTDEGCQLITNRSLGLTIVLPVGLSLRVRRRAHPSGSVAPDAETWSEVDESDDWNTLEARAPLDFHVELELLETPEVTMTLKSLKGGWLTRLLAGKVQSVREDLRVGPFRGFSVTRTAANGKTVLSQSVLFDGRRQLFIQGRWAEDSMIGARALDAVIDSLRVHS